MTQYLRITDTHVEIVDEIVGAALPIEDFFAGMTDNKVAIGPIPRDCRFIMNGEGMTTYVIEIRPGIIRFPIIDATGEQFDYMLPFPWQYWTLSESEPGRIVPLLGWSPVRITTPDQPVWKPRLPNIDGYLCLGSMERPKLESLNEFVDAYYATPSNGDLGYIVPAPFASYRAWEAAGEDDPMAGCRLATFTQNQGTPLSDHFHVAPDPVTYATDYIIAAPRPYPSFTDFQLTEGMNRIRHELRIRAKQGTLATVQLPLPEEKPERLYPGYESQDDFAYEGNYTCSCDTCHGDCEVELDHRDDSFCADCFENHVRPMCGCDRSCDQEVNDDYADLCNRCDDGNHNHCERPYLCESCEEYMTEEVLHRDRKGEDTVSCRKCREALDCCTRCGWYFESHDKPYTTSETETLCARCATR